MPGISTQPRLRKRPATGSAPSGGARSSRTRGARFTKKADASRDARSSSGPAPCRASAACARAAQPCRRRACAACRHSRATPPAAPSRRPGLGRAQVGMGQPAIRTDHRVGEVEHRLDAASLRGTARDFARSLAARASECGERTLEHGRFGEVATPAQQVQATRVREFVAPVERQQRLDDRGMITALESGLRIGDRIRLRAATARDRNAGKAGQQGSFAHGVSPVVCSDEHDPCRIGIAGLRRGAHRRARPSLSVRHASRAPERATDTGGKAALCVSKERCLFRCAGQRLLHARRCSGDRRD